MKIIISTIISHRYENGNLKIMNYFFRYENNISKSLDIRGGVLLKGLALATKAVHLAQTFLVLHSINRIPIGTFEF